MAGRCFHRMRLREQGKAAHARALPDQIRDIDLRLTSRRISQAGQHTIKRKRCERLTSQRTSDALDDNIDAATFRDTGDAISETLGSEIDYMFKTKGPCLRSLGLVVVEIAFPAPCAPANWVTALPTAPPIAGARTVLPGSKPAWLRVICAVR